MIHFSLALNNDPSGMDRINSPLYRPAAKQLLIIPFRVPVARNALRRIICQQFYGAMQKRVCERAPVYGPICVRAFRLYISF